MRSMTPAPATELAHLDPIRVVAPVLVRLIVAPLAVLAGERHCNSDVSASHPSIYRETEKDRARARLRQRIAPGSEPTTVRRDGSRAGRRPAHFDPAEIRPFGRSPVRGTGN